MKIAAVFCTMNRWRTAEICLERLAAQSVRPWKVVIADNDSEDETLEVLSAFDRNRLDLEVIAVGRNLGNAGGVRVAMERAFDRGAEGVWILDDDSWPEPEALEELLSTAGPDCGVRSSLVMDPSTGRPSWPFQVTGKEGWELVEEIPPDCGEWLRVRRAWLGALVPRNVWQEVGPVMDELFLRGEDEDYPRRIAAAGHEFHLATRSILHHPPGGELHRIRLFGRDVVLEADLPAPKLYYRLRNAWWLTMRDRGRLVGIALASFHLWILLTREPEKMRKLAIGVEAFLHAWRGRLGRRPEH